MKLNSEIVRTRCQEIKESITRLEEIRKEGKTRFLENQDLQDIACYRLLVAIEAALNLCYHIAAKQLRKVPDEYAQCFQLLEEARIIPSHLSENLQRMARFRNLLVHMYWKIDYEQVFVIVHKDLEDLNQFTKIMAELI
ncbi:MAG: DUF86 domain-containing protein [Deltaproteobacteria bacterium]|nr:DUF86 domain-containing protein [Deltaproteobacteria bacterium]